MPNESIPWPDHWYHDRDHIHCIVPSCGFVVPTTVVTYQWQELLDHCVHTEGTEHGILTKMLKQGKCCVDDCDHPSFNNGGHNVSHGVSTRALFSHELADHGSTKMSNICSFVTLAREGRVRGGPNHYQIEEVEKLAFERMLEKVEAMPWRTIELLFQKHRLHHPSLYPRTMFLGHLKWILTTDVLEKDGDDPPEWWPIRAEHFLWLCRPNPNNPADDEWRPVWRRLRDDYAEGRI